jgi:DNA modification methylase
MTRIETIAEGVTLYLGDYRDVIPMLPEVDAIVTSPPYAAQRQYITFNGDNYESLLGPIAAIPCKPDAQILVNLGLVHKDGFVIEYWEPFKRDMAKANWRLFGWYVWDQLSGMSGDWNGRLAPSFEFVFHFNKMARQVNKTKPTKGGIIHGPNIRNSNGSAAKKSHQGKAVQAMKIPDAVIRTARETQGGVPEAAHPARYPLAFAKELIAPFTNPGDLVMDPFLGSGTTGEAAVKLGRKFIGVEIEPKYFDIACHRIEASTKQTDMFFDAPALAAKQEAML